MTRSGRKLSRSAPWWIRLAVLLTVLTLGQVGLATHGRAQNATAAEQAGKSGAHESGITRSPDGSLKIGQILIREEEATLEVPAKVNMDQGLIEVLACTPGGKLHESLFVVDVDPHLLQVGLLLLLGLPSETVGQYPTNAPLEDFAPNGPSVGLRARWKDSEGVHDRPVQELICLGDEGRSMEEGRWLFTGSAIWENGFAAQTTGTLIATYLDPSAIINNGLPDASNDEAYTICHEIVPPKGTEVSLVFIAKDRIKLPEE